MVKVVSDYSHSLKNPLMLAIMDRSKPITQDIINIVLNFWKLDLNNLDNNDLASILLSLAERKAVVNIPTYKSMTAGKTKDNQVLISDTNRHGELIKVTGNKSNFKFSIGINDKNIMKSASVGDFRNFTVTDFNGDMYSGWDIVEFIPTDEEKKLGSRIKYDNFVNPNKWVSLFSENYIITKALINRLEEESKDNHRQMKIMKEAGITYDEQEGDKITYHESSKKTKSIKVDCFEVNVVIPDNSTQYVQFASKPAFLRRLTDSRRNYIYQIIPKLRFATRCIECAYYKFGNDKFPPTVLDASWETHMVKRTKWDKVVLLPGFEIRKRKFTKSERVSTSYEG